MANNIQLLELCLDAGIDTPMAETPINHFHRPKTNLNEIKKPKQHLPPPANHSSTTLAQPALSSPSELVSQAEQLAARAKTLAELKEKLITFEGCSLKKTAINTVISDGIDTASIMVIGEAPGADEDRQGIPFCGVSGKLLDQMFASIGLFREKNIYITNTIFWRPPGNRRPTIEETQICKPFLQRQIELLSPKLILLVGATSLNAVLDLNKPISTSRGTFFTYKEQTLAIPATPIFHPSYLLRAPIQKKKAWFDLLKIKAFIDKNIPD